MRPLCKVVGLPVALAVVATLAGCADALTVHSIVLKDDPVPDVPVIVGTWKRGLPDGQATLTFEGPADDVGQCRDGTGRFEAGEDVAATSVVCFVDIDGYLVAEVESGAPTEGFYRQFLVRFDGEDRLEVCGEATIWPLLRILAGKHAVGYSLDTLQHTTREAEYHLLMVFIARPREMREFLASALPELASACDSASVASDLGWIPYDRVPPDEQQAEEPAGD